MARRYEVEIKLRLSEKLRRKIERAAARNNRSMNTEILDRLEVTFGAQAPAVAGAAQASRDYEYLTGMRDKLNEVISWMTVPVEHGGKK